MLSTPYAKSLYTPSRRWRSELYGKVRYDTLIWKQVQLLKRKMAQCGLRIQTDNSHPLQNPVERCTCQYSILMKHLSIPWYCGMWGNQSYVPSYIHTRARLSYACMVNRDIFVHITLFQSDPIHLVCSQYQI